MAWQKAHAFVLAFYKTKRYFPEDEKFALVPQFQRAAVSIAANIAEGYKKVSKADKLRFFNIAQGSLEECPCRGRNLTNLTNLTERNNGCNKRIQ